MSEQSEFLKDLDIKQDDVLEKPLIEETILAENEEEKESMDQKARNRRERRLLSKNQQLREEAISAQARAQAFSEFHKFQEEVGENPLKEVEAIFGTDTPEKKAATDILKNALKGMSDSAVRQVLEKIEERKNEESQTLKKEEQNLDDIGDRMEEDYGIDMSVDGRAFYSLLEKLSPKDNDGNIIEYADPDATAELFLSRKEKSNQRAKDLANRSMFRGGNSQETKLNEDVALRFLKENGII